MVVIVVIIVPFLHSLLTKCKQGGKAHVHLLQVVLCNGSLYVVA